MSPFELRLSRARRAATWRARLWGSVAFSGVIASTALLVAHSPCSQIGGGIGAAIGAGSIAWLLRCSWGHISACGTTARTLGVYAPLLSVAALMGAYGVAQPADLLPLPTFRPPAIPVAPWMSGNRQLGAHAVWHCVVERPYDDGRTLSIAIPRRGPVLLVLHTAGMTAAQGETWPVTIAVDGMGAARTAEAQGDDAVAIPFGNPADLGRIHSGSVLMVRSASEVAEYRLDGVASVMAALNTCLTTLGDGK